MAGGVRTWTDSLSGLLVDLDELLDRLDADDWQLTAVNVGWSCWATAEHIAGDFAHYAGQVAGSPHGHYVTFGFDTSRASTPDELREVVMVAGRLLIGAVQTADPQSAGWHPHGYFNPEGFAAMGAAEGLVHGHDIASALGLDWDPDQDLCTAVLSKLFPDAAPNERQSPLEALLVRTGRDSHVESPRPWTYSGGAVRT